MCEVDVSPGFQSSSENIPLKPVTFQCTETNENDPVVSTVEDFSETGDLGSNPGWISNFLWGSNYQLSDTPYIRTQRPARDVSMSDGFDPSDFSSELPCESNDNFGLDAQNQLTSFSNSPPETPEFQDASPHAAHIVLSSPDLHSGMATPTPSRRRLSECSPSSVDNGSQSLSLQLSAGSTSQALSLTSTSNQTSASKRRPSLYYSLAPSYKTKLDQFRRIFLGTPVDTDRLLVDYSCALSKNNHGLLLQGRMYVTENWVCFYSKILQEQKIYLSVKEIIAITKEKTARVIPNAIQVLYSRNHQRFFFTSFASRERTYAILRKVWENCRNHQTMTLDEIVQQVREIYGDDSLAMLDDEDSDNVDVSANLPTGQSQSTSESAEENSIQDDRSPDDWLPPLESISKSSTVSTDDEGDEVRFSLSDTKPSAAIPDVVQHEPRKLDHVVRRSQKSAPRSMSETDRNPADSHSADPGVSNNELMRRSKKRQKRAQDSIKLAPQPMSTSALLDFPLEPLDDCATCFPGHDHIGQIYVNTLIPLSVDALFTCIFTDSEFFDRLSTSRGTFNMVQASWPSIPWSSDVYKPSEQPVTVERVIAYTLCLKQKLGPRTCAAVERQTLLVSESRPRQCYVVDAKVTNHAVPLCNCFCVVSRYCLLRAGPSSSRLCVHSRVVYEKPVFFGAKSIIENTCRSGLTDFFTSLTAQLTELSSCLSDKDRITGGFLSAPSTNAAVTHEASRKSKEKKLRGKPTDRSSETSSTAPGTNAADKRKGSTALSSPVSARNRTAPNDTGYSCSPTATEISFSSPLFAFGEITHFFLNPDRAWFLLCLLSLLLCLCLSLVYTRLVALEHLAEHLSTVKGPSPRLPDHHIPLQPLTMTDESHTRLRVMKELTATMSKTLSQMQQILSKVEASLDVLDRVYSDSSTKNAEANSLPVFPLRVPSVTN